MVDHTHKKEGHHDEEVHEEGGHRFVKKELEETLPEQHMPAKKSPRKKNGGLDERVEEHLVEIYENSDGTLPDMKTFDKKERNKFVTAAIALLASCLFLGGVAWAGFFVIQPRGTFSEEDVVLSVAGDEKVTYGKEIQYRIRYKNAQKVPLGSAVLQVRYPKGFLFSDSSVTTTNDTHDEWALGAISGDGSGYIDIKGKMMGDRGSRQSLRAFLNYKPANFSSEFQKVATFTTEVTGAPVALSFALPDEVVVGADTTITITVKPEAGEQKGVVVRVDPGDGFTKKQSVPESDEFQAYEWTFSELKEEKTITLTGSFQGAADVNATKVKVTVLAHEGSGSQEARYVLAEEEREMKLAHTEISAQVVINGSTSELSATPGEPLHATVVVKNVSQKPLENAWVRLIFEGPSYNKQSIIHWSEIEDSLDANITGEQISDTLRRGVIMWTRQQKPELTSIQTGQSVQLDVSLPLKSADIIDLTQFKTHEITARVELRYDGEGKQEILSGNVMKIIVNSDLALEVRDEVQDEAGKDMHLITWVLSNNFHELENVVLEADFYGDITWEDRLLTVPAGRTYFDDTTKKLKWTVEKMPTNVDVLPLRFALIINAKNPTQINLTSQVRIQAKDTVTGQEIVKVGEAVLLKSE